MPKSSDIKNALTNRTFVGDRSAQIGALDALLLIDPADTHAFKKALIDHEVFWKAQPYFNGIAFENNDAFLTVDAALQEIPPLVAQQRVVLGLSEVNDEVLIKILSNNQDECRAYIASLPKLGSLSQVHGWKADVVVAANIQPPPPPANSHTDVLSNEAIVTIKQNAANLLFSHLIKSTENHELLTAILNAKNKPAFDEAIKKIGFPVAGNESLALPLSAERKAFLDEKIKSIKNNAAHNGFEAYANTLSLEQKSALKPILEKATPAEFRAQLDEPFKTELADSDLDWAKGVLGHHYLLAVLYNRPGVTLQILNSKDASALQAELKTLLGNHNYLDHAVTDETFPSIKKVMLHNYIESHLNAAQLKALDAAADLGKFTEELKNAGITSTDWVKNEDLKDIKQWIRSRHFVLTMNESSQIGIRAHPALFALFNTLPDDKQRDLLNKPQVLQKILHATDAETVAHYLGKNREGVRDLLLENEFNASYKGIHNAAVAKILAGFDPLIFLNEDQIAKINEALLAANEISNAFTEVAVYKIFVDEIKKQCGDVDKKKFYEAFNLNQDGTAFSATTSGKDAIAAQSEYNKGLFAAYVLPEHATHKKFLDVLLSMDKEINIGTDRVQGIKDLFDKSNSVREFVNKLIPEPRKSDPPLNSKLRNFKTRLLNEFSVASFDAIKNGILNEQFKLASADEVTQAIEKVQKDLTAMQALHKSIVDSTSHFKPVEKVEPHHLYNPTFQGTAQVHAIEMKEKYKEYSANCNDIVDQLRRNKKSLEDYLQNLPQSSELNAGLPAAEKKKIEALRNQLTAELALVKKNLEFYEAVQEKLSGEKGILQAIDEAVEGKKSYVFHAEGVTRRFSTSAKMDTLPQAGSTPLPKNSGVNTSGQTNDTQKFVLGEAIPEGQIAVFDVVKTNYDSKNAIAFESRGRFTHDPSPLAAVSSKGDKISKIPGGNFEIVEFPKQTVPPAATGSAEDARLTKARIEFSMTMAAEILASMDGPPTKNKPLKLYGANEEEMRYLWTALVVLGEKDPKMKFGPEAIKLDKYGDNNFDPSAEMGRFWGYTNESLYAKFQKQEFKTSIDNKAEALADVTKDKFGKKDERDNLDAKVIKANESLKNDLQQVKAKAKADTAEKGPAVHSSKPPGM